MKSDPIPQADLEALAYAGMMGHTHFGVRTSQDGRVSASLHCSTPAQLMKHSLPGDRLYVKVAGKVRRFNAPIVITPEERSALEDFAGQQGLKWRMVLEMQAGCKGRRPDQWWGSKSKPEILQRVYDRIGGLPGLRRLKIIGRHAV